MSYQPLNEQTLPVDDDIPLLNNKASAAKGDGSSSFPEKPTSVSTQNDLIRLNAFWFGYQYCWFLLGIVIMPSQIEAIVGSAKKGEGIATISFFSGLLFLFFSPIWGALNDKYVGNRRWGKRRPFIMIGCAGMCFSLFLMSNQVSIWFYNFAYLSFNFFAIICSIPFNGLVSDVTPAALNGQVSSVMGALNLSGYLLGAVTGIFAAQLNIYVLYFIMCSIFGSCTYITCFFIQEKLPRISATSRTFSSQIDWKNMAWDIVKPLYYHRNFMLVFVSRFLFQLGIATIQSFLQYWISDCVATELDSQTAVSIAMVPNLFLAPICALLAPKTNRKRTVYFSAAMMMIASLLMMFASDFGLALLVSSLFGIGYGPFMSSEFGMLMDTLPNQEDSARDMSLWHTALVLPQIVSTPLAGWLLDYYQQVGLSSDIHCLGYKVTNAFTISYLIIGCLVTSIIAGIQ